MKTCTSLARVASAIMALALFLDGVHAQEEQSLLGALVSTTRTARLTQACPTPAPTFSPAATAVVALLSPRQADEQSVLSSVSSSFSARLASVSASAASALSALQSSVEAAQASVVSVQRSAADARRSADAAVAAAQQSASAGVAQAASSASVAVASASASAASVAQVRESEDGGGSGGNSSSSSSSSTVVGDGDSGSLACAASQVSGGELTTQSTFGACTEPEAALAIAGIALGAIGLLSLGVTLVIWCRKRRTKTLDQGHERGRPPRSAKGDGPLPVGDLSLLEVAPYKLPDFSRIFPDARTAPSSSGNNNSNNGSSTSSSGQTRVGDDSTEAERRRPAEVEQEEEPTTVSPLAARRQGMIATEAEARETAASITSGNNDNSGNRDSNPRPPRVTSSVYEPFSTAPGRRGGGGVQSVVAPRASRAGVSGRRNTGGRRVSSAVLSSGRDSMVKEYHEFVSQMAPSRASSASVALSFPPDAPLPDVPRRVKRTGTA